MPAIDRVHAPTPEELMAFLDGETSAQERASIEAHVVACSQCRQLISDLGGVNRAMAAWQPEPAPVTLRPPRVVRSSAVLLPRIPRIPRPFSWRPGYRVIAFGGAATTLVLVASLSTLKPALRGTAAREHLTAAKPISVVNGAVDGRLEQNGSAAKFGAAHGALPGAVAKPESLKIAREDVVALQPGTSVTEAVTVPRQPSVIRTATLRLVATDFNAARASVESIVAQAGGFLDQITVNGAPGAARTLTGSLRVQADRLADALSRLRQLGQVTEDTQGTEDVTDQLVDLEARLANARATEQRLNDILKNRTGKLSDVLQVEQEVSRVRLEIEQMDAQRLNTSRRVTYATIALEIDEIRKAGLESGPLSLATRVRVAAADGLESALESLVGAVLFMLRAGPATALWLTAALGVWLAARRVVRARPSTAGDTGVRS